MTTKTERTRAVLEAERFLMLIADGDGDTVRGDMARAILRHYPTRYDLWAAHKALPEIWADPDAVDGQRTRQRAANRRGGP